MLYTNAAHDLANQRFPDFCATLQRHQFTLHAHDEASDINLVAQGSGLAPWPDALDSPLGWRLQRTGRDTEVVLESATGIWNQRPLSLRAHWFHADLDDPGVEQTAMELSRHLSWHRCLRTAIHVPGGAPGSIIKGASDPCVEARGELHILRSSSSFTLELPQGGKITHELDRRAFLHQLACAGFDGRELERFSIPRPEQPACHAPPGATQPPALAR